jgi:hypothetical protein
LAERLKTRNSGETGEGIDVGIQREEIELGARMVW